MRCSNCSRVIKPVVAHDIDGSFGDFHVHFLAFAESYLGVDPLHYSTDYVAIWNDYDGSIGFKEWFCEEYDINSVTWRQIKLAYRQGGMKRTMPCFKASRNIAEYTRSQGAELWITTSRPAYRLDNIDPDTLEWCRRNRIPFDHILFDDDKYDLLAEQVDSERVIAVFDDLGEMYDIAALRFGPDIPVLLKGHWNQGVSRPHEAPAGRLTETAFIVGKRISTWKKAHS
jgi:hypothetical protein